MAKKGLVKIQIHSFDSSRIKDPNCTVRIRCSDVELNVPVNCKEEEN